MATVSELTSKNIADTQANVRNWGRLVYNVREYGLVGDGVTDDTANLQALIDLAILDGRKTIAFNSGVYYVTTLTNADQVFFVGDNASFTGGYAGYIEQLGEMGATQTEFDALKAETASQFAGEVSGKSFTKGIISFVFDDGTESIYDNAFSLFQAKGWPACVAFSALTWNNPSTAGLMTREEIIEMQEAGWEVVGHGMTGRSINNTLASETAEWELGEAQRLLTNYGFKVKQFAAPNSSFGSNHTALLKKYYDAGYLLSQTATADVTMDNPVDVYNLSRYNMEGKTLAELKALVDVAASTPAWIIFTEHNIGIGGSTLSVADLTALLDYIETKDVDVLTGTEAVSKVSTRLIAEERPSRLSDKTDETLREGNQNLLLNAELDGYGSALQWTWDVGTLTGGATTSVSTTKPGMTLILVLDGTNTGAAEQGEYYQDFTNYNTIFIEPYVFSFYAQGAGGYANAAITAKITAFNGVTEVFSAEEEFSLYPKYRRYSISRLMPITGITKFRVSIIPKNKAISNAVNIYWTKPKLEVGTKPSEWTTGLPLKDSFSVQKSATQVVATSSWTRVTFDTENFDTYGLFSSNLYQSKDAGKRLMSAGVTFAATVSGAQYKLALYKNGLLFRSVTQQSSATTKEIGLSLSDIVDTAGNNTWEVYAWQDSGVTQTIQVTGTWFSGATIN